MKSKESILHDNDQFFRVPTSGGETETRPVHPLRGRKGWADYADWRQFGYVSLLIIPRALKLSSSQSIRYSTGVFQSPGKLLYNKEVVQVFEWVLHRYRTSDNSPLWASNTNGQEVKEVVMQGDGNLVGFFVRKIYRWQKVCRTLAVCSIQAQYIPWRRCIHRNNLYQQMKHCTAKKATHILRVGWGCT